MSSKKKLSAIYIGEGFYWKSGTNMANLLEEFTHRRLCFQDIAHALEDGLKVEIRPANDKEMVQAYKMLENYVQ